MQARYQVATAAQMLAGNRQLLGAYDPKKRLAQGWSIVTGADEAVVRSLTSIIVGEDVRITLSDGSFTATVNKKNGAS
jgi:exonuclease VII large subunit